MSFQSNGTENTLADQWLGQLQAMRAAIAELRLTAQNLENGIPYGHDIVINDSSSASPSEEDDVWDFISDKDDRPSSSDEFDSTDGDAEPVAKATSYDSRWLASMCDDVSRRTSGLDSQELRERVFAVLSSNMEDDELQIVLAETLGYDELELVTDLLAHRSSVVRSAANLAQDTGPLDRLQTREQRMSALERQDYEHKHAPVAEAVNRNGESYPHVYKGHDAGNTLSSYGRKYALPNGSSRLEHDVCGILQSLHLC